jgi:hypothetical protein
MRATAEDALQLLGSNVSRQERVLSTAPNTLLVKSSYSVLKYLQLLMASGFMFEMRKLKRLSTGT